MIIVDTNVIAYALIKGEKTKTALDVYQKDSDWCLPELWRHEFLNVLALYLRQGGLDVTGARQAWRSATALFDPGVQPVVMEDALEIAATDSISAYDAEFVTLARSMRMQLVTEDQGLQKKFPGTAVSMQDFLVS